MSQTKQLTKLALSEKTQELIELEHKYSAGGFQPLPAFFVEGKGAKLWVRESKGREELILGSTTQDVDGKEYIDFIAMFSAVNTGQCNPKIIMRSKLY